MDQLTKEFTYRSEVFSVETISNHNKSKWITGISTGKAKALAKLEKRMAPQRPPDNSLEH